VKDKTLLITGVSRGLGLALANYWSQENTIIGISRTQSPEMDADIIHYNCDLANEDETLSTIRKIVKNHKNIDVLINNAAVLTSLPVGILKPQDISRMIDVNLKAPILLSKVVFRKMIASKGGQIINITSMAPKLSVVGDSVYAATKSGLEAFSKVLNKEGHQFGIHVNNLGISAYPSGMLEQVLTDNSEKILNLIPHKQFAEFDQIVSALEFLGSGHKDIGGQTIYLGGV